MKRKVCPFCKEEFEFTLPEKIIVIYCLCGAEFREGEWHAHARQLPTKKELIRQYREMVYAYNREPMAKLVKGIDKKMQDRLETFLLKVLEIGERRGEERYLAI